MNKHSYVTFGGPSFAVRRQPTRREGFLADMERTVPWTRLLALSLGQQQRLVIARAIAVEPEVLMLDEPASALDPAATLRFEELLHELATRYTLLLVTHNMQQAARVSDFTAFMHDGRLVEFGDTDALFTNPRERQTEDFITGRYG